MNKAWKENNLLKENEYDKEWSGVLIHYKTGKKAKTELKAKTLNDLKKKASEIMNEYEFPVDIMEVYTPTLNMIKLIRNNIKSPDGSWEPDPKGWH